MDQNPIVGWLKIAAFAILAWLVWMSVWQTSKVEDKLVRLDESMSEARERARDNEKLLAKIAANNELLTDLIVEAGIGQRGGVAAAESTGSTADSSGEVKPTKTNRKPTSRRGKKDVWGWDQNEGLDKDLDPTRPLGTPGRYKNFLKLDPDAPEAYTGEHDPNETITMGWSTDPKGFNSLLENFATLSDYCTTYIMSSGGSRHWKRPSSFNWAPDLAWRVEVNEDFTEYTLFLRRDAMWHRPPINLNEYPHLRGKHAVTAKDIEFTYALIMDPQSNCGVTRAYLEKLESVKAIDDFTVVFKWTETSFTSLAGSIGFSVMPKFLYGSDEDGEAYPVESVAQEFNNHWFDRLRKGPVGCGPYRFVKYEPGKFIKLERYDDWHGFKDQPKFAIRNIHYKIYTGGAELNMNRLRAGEIDVGGLNGTRYREWVMEETDPASPFKNGDINVELKPRTGYLYLGWKNSDKKFKDKRVRQALTYASNRQEICEKIFLKRYRPMASPVFPDSEEADPKLKPYPYDPEKAKQLLDEAGWKLNSSGVREKTIDGEKVELKFDLYWPGPSAEFQNALDHIKNDYQNIGVIMTPQSIQWTQFQKDLRDREYTAFSLLWMTNGWEHDFGQIWHSKQIEDPTSSNYIEFSNKELDELQDRLRTLMDPAERVKVIHRIGNILYEEQPYTFFGWQSSYFSWWKHVKGIDKRYFIRPMFRMFPLHVER